MSSPTHQHMKLFNSLFLLLFVIVISGCSSRPSEPNDPSWIWDYRSTSFEISIKSPKGQSLINPTTQEGYELLQGIKISYNGETYQCQDRPARELRAMPEFYKALYVEARKGEYRLVFGEFQPHYPRLEAFTLHLPGGEKYEIKFTHTAEDGRFYTKVWVNDIQNSSNTPFNITLTTANPIWNKMLASKTARPVTLYILPQNIPTTIVDKREVLEESFYKECSLTFRGETYPLLKETWEEDRPPLAFRAATLQILDEVELGKFKPVLIFGPISTNEKLVGEELQLRYKGETYSIYLVSFLDPSGTTFYKAWTEMQNHRFESSFFHNGPMIRLLFKR